MTFLGIGACDEHPGAFLGLFLAASYVAACSGAPTTDLPVCGNGKLESPAEECDDGNTVDGDDCTARCKIAVCGDGIVNENSETCDDSNDVDTDNCTNECQIASCGDGVVWAGVEPCDDRNDVDDDSVKTIAHWRPAGMASSNR